MHNNTLFHSKIWVRLPPMALTTSFSPEANIITNCSVFLHHVLCAFPLLFFSGAHCTAQCTCFSDYTVFFQPCDKCWTWLKVKLSDWVVKYKLEFTINPLQMLPCRYITASELKLIWLIYSMSMVKYKPIFNKIIN